ncbi:hypothetical protein BCTU_240 [Buchnera aphidicola (Cinara tujafilina)]|uniref:2-iminobutanoate/2-iminopropanoate deaminase n=1 Tax=Buchnera aphidicola (Cinara tujafilina) TaxID=261317 RepID=F7WZF9_9GAMM|nr:Rid family detoxifying hydrolase [Buchnera aphidicola]AEH39821.1 hypothetical protein BCTU_240 [Buchnera aphidicola (Cinara tujafilina)]
MKNIKSSNKEIKIYGPYAPYIKSGNLLYISGQIPIDNKNKFIPKNISEQTCLSLKNIKNILNINNLCMKHIIKTTIFTTKLEQLKEINLSYSNFFKKYTNLYPTRSCVGVLNLPKNVLIEIEVIASYK